MLIKILKYVGLCTVMMLAGGAWANGLTPEDAAAPAQQSSFDVIGKEQLALASQNGVFVGANYGRIWQDWRGESVNTGSDSENGQTYSLFSGYQYSAHSAAQVSFIVLPSIGSTLRQYALSATFKLMQPLRSDLSLYSKAGVAYRYFTQNTLSGILVRPQFGAGVEYTLNMNFSFDAQYDYLVGDNTFGSADIARVPGAHLLTIGFNYNMSV